MFVIYAHRGASEYYPENTLSSFAAGVDMGANGIETDVQMTKDGYLVLFHDDCMKEKTGFEGAIKDYTLGELDSVRIENKKYGRVDRIMLFEDFLRYFAWRDLTLAIELKMDGIAAPVIDLIKKYNALDKCIITSFSYKALEEARAYDSEVKLGWLYVKRAEDTIERLKAIDAIQGCPKEEDIRPEDLDELYSNGFGCRAWGIAGEENMRRAVDIGVSDGMTVNFPDKLIEYLK